MLKQIAVATIIAAGGVFLYKHRNNIKNFLFPDRGGGFNSSKLAISPEEFDANLEREVAHYMAVLSDPTLVLSPYQACLKNGLFGSPSKQSIQASGQVIRDCRAKYNPEE